MAQTVDVDCRVVAFREEDLSWAVSGLRSKLVGAQLMCFLGRSASLLPLLPGF